MAQFEPVPTYADPVIVGGKDEQTGKEKSVFNPVWLQWFLRLAGGGLGSVTDHDSLSGLQGGVAGQYYHLTAAEHAAVNIRNTGAVAAIGVGASPFTYINPHTYDVDIILIGGAGVGTTFSRDGATFYTVTPLAMIRLSPADRVVVTYAGAPTMVEVPR
jgi:hypothetical protein